MTNNILTIGRAETCDIQVPQSYDTVSNEHAEIELRGEQLIFFDHSTNGTIINNQKIHNTNVGIYPGDTILLAGKFPLDWDTIGQYFPIRSHRPTVVRNLHAESQSSQPTPQPASDWEGRRTMQMNGNGPTPAFFDKRSGMAGYGQADMGRKTEQFSSERFADIRQESERHVAQPARDENYGIENTYSQAEKDKAIKKWSWGGFLCGWIFAVRYKQWWALLMIVIAQLPYAGAALGLAFSVYMGMNGSKMAWDSGLHKTFESYKLAQTRWAMAGIVFFILQVCFAVVINYYGLTLF